MAMHPKYIFVTGGVLSSLGKGIAASAIGALLEAHGLKVAMMKLDPYLNVDPGTMNPYQHGEVYVTDDGAETDLDLGHYFRFTHSPISAKSSVTSGQVYHEVIKRERYGEYLGKTVQVIPHVTDEIKARIGECARQCPDIDIVIVEVGGTVGDIESLPFLEAVRQFRCDQEQRDHGRHCLNIHVTYVPYIKSAGEVKTKPTQHSVQQLRQIGLFPDIILCRAENALSDAVKDKISLFCNVPKEAVIEAIDVETTIYEVPLLFYNQGIDALILKRLEQPTREQADLSKWRTLVETIRHPKGTLVCGVVGKYVQHQDAYKSVFEALSHAAADRGYAIDVRRIDADALYGLEALPGPVLGCDGYLIPGGFGDRGWNGKILTAQHCRTSGIPYFGICLGMQVMVVEFSRHALGLVDADSTEMSPQTAAPVIDLLEQQRTIVDRGGTMRRGLYPCALKEGTLARAAYGCATIPERHRHRYELNNRFRPALEQAGLTVSGVWTEGNLGEIVEVTGHPWMVGVQFHPEFCSRPFEPHPLFAHFIDAMIARTSGAP